ncbi:hypothetical protein Tco_1531849, partial [Tanacetum coccineum]
MCYDDPSLITPHVSALAGCDRVVSRAIGYKEVVPEEEPIEKKPLEEPKEEELLEESEEEADLDLMYGSFDVVEGMGWLSKHRAKIVYHEKVVRITLAKGEKLDDIPIVQDFLEVFPKDLMGLPPHRQVEFSPLPESLPKEAERYTRSPARATYSLKRLVKIVSGISLIRRIERIRSFFWSRDDVLS